MTRTILTVLAAASDRAAAKDILSNAGYNVEEAESGAAAFEAFNGHKHDLVLMDVQLPDMEGIEAYRAMCLVAYKPIIWCTVIGQEAATMKAVHESSRIGREEEDVDLALKPFKADRLIKTVKEQIRNFYDPLGFEEE